MPGWGLLLVLGVPFLIYFSWSRLESETSRINLERFENFVAGETAPVVPMLESHFQKFGKPALPGEVSLPDVPANRGIKAWSVRPDTSLRVELDAKVGGRAVHLHYVPVVVSANRIVYECVSATPAVHVGKFCRSTTLRSVSDIAAQLRENARLLASPSAGAAAAAGAATAGPAMGSVVSVPEPAADLERCGFQCVMPQSCAAPRPLACARTVDEGNRRWLDVAPTLDDVAAITLPTRSAADRLCEQSLGAGYRVLTASHIGGVVKLRGGHEAWVHNDMRTESNCWETDTR